MIYGPNLINNIGKNILKKVKNSTIPACQTINVVMSPNGLKAPPALAATTIFIQPIEINLEFPFPQAITTEHITRAVVKLSAIGERKKVIIPVKMKSCLKLKPLDVN